MAVTHVRLVYRAHFPYSLPFTGEVHGPSIIKAVPVYSILVSFTRLLFF